MPFLLCLVLIALLIHPAQAWGWVDQPTTRKHHQTPIPLVGGAAMCGAYCLTLLIVPIKTEAYSILLVSVTLLTSVGLYDDLHAIQPKFRFLFQIAAVLLMGFGGGMVLFSLGDLFGSGVITLIGAGSFLFTIFGVVGVINAMNMSDGLDGLAGGIGFIVTGWLIVLIHLAAGGGAQQQGDSGALLALAAVIAGFLCFNLRHPWRSRANVFMGDAGSTMLGFILGWFMVRLSQGSEAVMDPMTAVWLLALPLMDAVTVMLRRIWDGHNPFFPDRQHLHHLLLSRGLTDGQVTALLLCVSFLTGGVGVLAYGLKVPEWVQFYSFLICSFSYYKYTTRYWRLHEATALPADSTTYERRSGSHSKNAFEKSL